MKKSLWALSGLLALGIVSNNAWSQVGAPVTQSRRAASLGGPVATEPAGTAEACDPFGLPAPRIQRGVADLGAPDATDAQPERLPDMGTPSSARSTAMPVSGASGLNLAGTGCISPALASWVSPTGCNLGQNCTPRGLYLGAGIYFARPVFSSNPAFVTTVTQTVANPNLTQTHTKDFDWNYQATPKIWAGYIFDNGWGVAFNYWHFKSDPESAVIIHPADQPGVQTFGSTSGALPIPVRSNFPPIPPDTIHVDSGLQVDTYDLELLKVGGFDNGYWKAGLGGRYGFIRQSYTATLVNTGNPPNFLQDELNTFSGWGPTVSGEMGVRVWRRVGIYGLGRVSYLFGHSHQEASQIQTGTAPNLLFTANNDKLVAVPVGEIELGLSWQADYRRMRFMVRSGFAAQMWWDAGSASIPAGGTFSSLGAQSPQGVFFPVSTATNSNLGFLGWTFSLGLQY